MSKIKRKTSKYVKWITGGIMLAVAGFFSIVLPNPFSKDYSNQAPKLFKTVNADSPYTTSSDTTYYNDTDGFDGACDGSADTGVDCTDTI